MDVHALVTKNTQNLSTKDKISVETFRLLREFGVQNVTINQICKASEITKSTFYYYYHSVDDVIETFTDIILLDLTQAIPTILQQETCVEQALLTIRIIDESVEKLGVAVASSRYVMHLKKGDYPGFQAEAGWEQVLATLRKAIALGEIPDDRSAEQVAETVYTIMRGVNHTWCMCGGNFNFPERVQCELRAYFGLLVEKAASKRAKC